MQNRSIVPGPRKLRSRMKTLWAWTCGKAREFHSTALFGKIIHFDSTPMQVSSKRTIVFAPHPDDETFGCGGLIALKREQNVPVQVVFLTDGSGSHGDRGIREGQKLAALRREEANCAAAALGLSSRDLAFLGYPDRHLGHMPPSRREEAVFRIVGLLEEFQPGEIYVTHRRDKHVDHEASYALVMQALRQSGLKPDVFQYTIWAVWWSALGTRLRRNDLANSRKLTISGVSEKKRKAIEAYRSQLEILPPGFLKRFLGRHEVYFVAPSESARLTKPGASASLEGPAKALRHSHSAHSSPY